MRPLLSFVVVTYNNADTIELCLESIARCTSNRYEITIIDNSPNDLTLQAVRRFTASCPDVGVRLVARQENIGFSRGCNLGAAQSTGEYLFFLNPDTQLRNDAGMSLARCLEEHPYAMAAGPAIFDRAGQVTRTCRTLPKLGHVILDATGLDRWWGAYKLTRFDHQESKQVGQIIGAAILIRRAVYERLGGMDERFFVYFEEVDLCKRLKEAGGEVWFWPDAEVQHLAGASCEAVSVRARMIFIFRASRRKYFAKHYGVWGGLLLEMVNRLEAFQKSAVLIALWMFRRKRSHREKAYGFWAVVTGITPRI